MISYARLANLTGTAGFTSSTTKAALTSNTVANNIFTERPPKEQAVSGGWIGIGKSSRGNLVLDLPGDASTASLNKWRWFKVETMQPNPRAYTPDHGYVKITTEQAHLEMFSLLTYFLLSRMAIAYKEGDSPSVLVERALEEWEQYLGTRAEDQSSLHTGAFGEIYVLNRLIKEIGPCAVQGWVGPRGESQDMRVSTEGGCVAGLEVKTVGTDADTLQINGTTQLNSPGLLLAVRLGAGTDPLYTGSLGGLIAQVESALVDHPEEIADFRKKLEYLSLDESSEHYTRARSIIKVEYWDMKDLPRVSVSGPGKDNLWPIRSTLRPGPGATLSVDDWIKPILGGCAACADGGDAL